MEKWFQTSPDSIKNIILCAVGIYIVVIIFTKLVGKRSFSKMSSFDFAITIAIGSILASTILSSSVSLLDGAIGLATVYILQLLVATLRRFPAFQKLVDNSPLLLMDGEKILVENLKKAHVTRSDLYSKLREANVLQFSQVKAVVFEATGDISVLHSTEKELQVDEDILKNVQQ